MIQPIIQKVRALSINKALLNIAAAYAVLQFQLSLDCWANDQILHALTLNMYIHILSKRYTYKRVGGYESPHQKHRNLFQKFCVGFLLKLECHPTISIFMKNEFNDQDGHVDQAILYAKRLKLTNKRVRLGWYESAKAISMDGDDLLLSEFLNLDGEDLDWQISY